MRDLEAHIQATPLADTHEHLWNEAEYVNNGPDILAALFDNYISGDLVVAGATPEAVARVRDRRDPDLAGRWAGIAAAWPHCQHTGYGQAVRWMARHLFGLEAIDLPALEAAAPRALALRQPGERLRLLREVANLAFVQIDNLQRQCAPDPSGPGFFLEDISWWELARGDVDLVALQVESGVDVRDVPTLRAALAALFARYAPAAVAVKTQHAYNRTLLWTPRDDADVAAALGQVLAGEELSDAARLCLGDWCLARGVELAAEHDLPVKIHTGYYAGVSRMPVERIRPGHLGALLRAYPRARFVLLHLGYPYVAECVALTKHYPNVYADFAWAWSIDPYGAGQALRHLLRAAPINKVFAFGGDTLWPGAAAAYAAQARAGLARALWAEVEADDLSEAEAKAVATRVMWTNQAEVFRLPMDRAAE